MDDIKEETTASEAVGIPPTASPRSVGPESETRGGPEAADETLDDQPPSGPAKSATPGS